MFPPNEDQNEYSNSKTTDIMFLTMHLYTESQYQQRRKCVHKSDIDSTPGVSPFQAVVLREPCDSIKLSLSSVIWVNMLQEQRSQALWLNLAFFGVKVKFMSSFEM